MTDPVRQLAVNHGEQVAKAGAATAGVLFGLTWTDMAAIAQVFAGFGAFFAGVGTYRFYRSKRIREEAEDHRIQVKRERDEDES